MNRYYKDLANGTREWFKGSIQLNDMWVINPSEEQILAAGYTLWESQPYVPTIEDIRNDKLTEITNYDNSNEVNIFYLNGNPLWLDKATRVGLMLRFESEKAMEEQNTTLWAGTIPVTLPIDSAIRILHQLEVYASKCYDKTAEHKAAVMALETEEEIKEYDYTAGYPEKINLDF